MREYWEKGDSIVSIQNRLHVSPNTIKSWARKEGWSRPRVTLIPDDDETDGSDETDDDRQLDKQRLPSVWEKDGDTYKALIAGHQREWTDIEDIRIEALKAFKDPEFRPADASETWTAKDRLNHAQKLFAMYNTASNALMVAQEGERRAHGFDYRDQKKAAKEEIKDYAKQADALRKMMASVHALARMNKTIDGEICEHEATGSEPQEADGTGADQDHDLALAGPADGQDRVHDGAL
jgi:hypothetical protein